MRPNLFPDLIKNEIVDLSSFGVILGTMDLKIFVREEYLIALEKWKASPTGYILLGSPGIGKSSFGRLLLCLLISENAKIFYWSPGHFALLIEDGNARHITRICDVHSTDTVMIYDDRIGFQSTFGDIRFKKYLIIHSPSAHISNSIKAVGYGGMKWFMNPSTLEECLLIREMCSWSISQENLENNFVRFGGLLRYLQQDLKDADILDWCKHLSEGLASLLNLKEYHFNSNKHCHRIIHLRRVEGTVGEYFLCFSSNFVEEEVVKNFATINESQLLKLANQMDIHGSLRGEIFENRMHFSFKSFLNFTFHVRYLPCDDLEFSEISLHIPVSQSFKKVTDLKGVEVSECFFHYICFLKYFLPFFRLFKILTITQSNTND